MAIHVPVAPARRRLIGVLLVFVFAALSVLALSAAFAPTGDAALPAPDLRAAAPAVSRREEASTAAAALPALVPPTLNGVTSGLVVSGTFPVTPVHDVQMRWSLEGVQVDSIDPSSDSMELNLKGVHVYPPLLRFHAAFSTSSQGSGRRWRGYAQIWLWAPNDPDGSPHLWRVDFPDATSWSVDIPITLTESFPQGWRGGGVEVQVEQWIPRPWDYSQWYWQDELHVHGLWGGYSPHVVQGTVTTGEIDVSDRPWTTYDVDNEFSLNGVPVQLLKIDGAPGQEITTTVGRTWTDEHGHYSMPAPVADHLKLTVSLEHSGLTPQAAADFRILYISPTNSAFAITSTESFSITNDTPQVITEPIAIKGSNLTFSGDPGVPRARWQSLSTVYAYTWQAWKLEETLRSDGIPALDYDLPIDVLDYGEVYSYTCWVPGPDPFINIWRDESDTNSQSFPGSVWHEFGHHVQADLYGNSAIYNPGDQSHEGFVNPSTSDSWLEGFAEWYAALAAESVLAPRPDLYQLDDVVWPLELPFQPWGFWQFKGSDWNTEEFAVAGLLWDLTNPVDATNLFVLGRLAVAASGIITLNTPLTATLPDVAYHDHVQVAPATLWHVLFKPGRIINNVADLYHALQVDGIGQQIVHAPSRLTALDELFIMHGLYADIDPQNLYYDYDWVSQRGETIGETSNVTLTVHTGRQIDMRPRRSNPPIPDAYIAYQASESGSGAPVAIDHFVVSVSFAEPYRHFDYSYRAGPYADGRLHMVAPDAWFTTKVSIMAYGKNGLFSCAPLVMTSDTYWAAVRRHAVTPITSHMFRMSRSACGAWLPIIIMGGAQPPPPASPTATATSESARPATATATMTARPAATATPTATHADLLTATATASQTATAMPTATLSATPTATSQSLPSATRTGTPRPPSSATITATATPTRTATLTSTRTATPTTAPSGWQTIFTEGFEGAFPGVWGVSGNPYWGKTTCKAHSGSYSLWPATAGSAAVTPCVANYPNSMNTWISYGPFDLSDASAADVTFWRWQSTQDNHDYFGWYASSTNVGYNGVQSSGHSNAWIQTTFDLSSVPVLGNLCGKPQVWIAFRFWSDGSTGDAGVWLDDIVVRKHIGGSGSEISALSASAAGADVVAASGQP